MSAPPSMESWVTELTPVISLSIPMGPASNGLIFITGDVLYKEGLGTERCLHAKNDYMLISGPSMLITGVYCTTETFAHEHWHRS